MEATTNQTNPVMDKLYNKQNRKEVELKLHYRIFKRCTFNDIHFDELYCCKFIDCRFNHCIFESIKFTDFIMMGIFNHCKFNDDLFKSNYYGVNFNNCTFQDNIALYGSSFNYCDFNLSKIHDVENITDTMFVTCKYDKSLIVCISNLGYVHRNLVYFPKVDVVYVGCFRGNLKTFIKRVKKRYNKPIDKNEYLTYQDAIRYIKNVNKQNNIKITIYKIKRIFSEMFKPKML